MTQQMRKQILGVTLAVFALGIINGAWLTYIRSAYERDLPALAFYPAYVQTRAIVMNPVTYTSILITFFILFIVTWRRWRNRPVLVANELMALAMIEGMLVALILMACFKL
jgi:hypothetical protein